MTKDRIAVIIALLMCVAFAISLVGATINYSKALNQKDSEIEDLTSTIDDKNSQISELQDKVASDNTTINSLNAQIANLQSQVTSANNQISSLTSQIATLQNQVSDLTAIINMSKSSELRTLVFHVCEKGEGYNWGHLPDVNYTYNQILTLNNGTYDVLLLPEYRGNENWTETFVWFTENFSKIPIMLPVFEGGLYDYPIMKLTFDQISEVMTTCNVRWLRISEIVSWHLEQNLTFPFDYVTSILNFARAHSLRVQWSEWKVTDDVFQRIQSYIAGFEDIVTVVFQTNSGDLEPADGFALVSKMFQNWGGSVQSWYWTTRYGSEPLDMPVSLLVQHALAAKNIGAEILQFEPYWYFFDNGEPKENLKLLMTMLT